MPPLNRLHRFVQMPKESFIGRDGLADWQEKGFTNSFVTLGKGTEDADALGGNPLYKDGELVGHRATSGGYGFRVKKSLALAMISPELAETGTVLEIDILGRCFDAVVMRGSPFDPANQRLRA